MTLTRETSNNGPLPIDVLQEVFSLLISDISYNSEDRVNSDFDVKKLQALLFCLSAVSRHWRRAATSQGTLWTDAVNPLECNPDTFNYILSQTALAPLKLLGRSERIESAGISAPQWAKLLPHMDRVTHIDLGFPYSRLALEDLASCWGNLRPPRSNLQSLVLSCMSRHGLTYEGQRFQEGQELENLRTLKLYRVGISPQPVVYNNLTCLYIEIGEIQEAAIAAGWWQLCSSSGLKHLEHLAIRGITDTFLPMLPQLKATNFPQSLRSFSVEGNIAPCLGLLRLAEVPLTCTILFEANVLRRDIYGQGWDSLLAAISRFWNPSIGTCSLFRFSFTNEARFIFEFSEGRTVEIRLRIPLKSHLVFLVLFLNSLHQGEHLQRIISSSTWVQLEVERFVDQEDQVELLNRTVGLLLHENCKSLNSLHVVRYRIFGEEKDYTPRLFQRVTNYPRDTQAAVEMSIRILPSLKHLRLDDSLFDNFAFVTEVNSFLKYRAQSQSPVDTVERVYQGVPEPLSIPLLAISKTVHDGPGTPPLQKPAWQRCVSLVGK
ncbi:hypothetical protein MD484_g2880, partial [Candolleomyces efflorescens]